MDATPPPPLPLAPKVVIPPTSPSHPHGSPDCRTHLPPPGGNSPPPEASRPSNSLDTQESSVRRDFDAWLHEKGDKAEFFYEPALDTTSHSARFRHSGWAVFRKKIWESMIRTGQTPSRRRAFGECGSYSWTEQNVYKHDEFRFRHNHCHDRLCTPCANARSQRITAALLQVIGDQPVSFITLTLCGRGETLSDLIDRLFKHFRALRLHPTWADKVRGGAAFIEVKWSDKAQRWHPHLHIIADASFINQGELSDVWRGISKDSFIVDIRRVKNPQVTGHYVTKYASKPINSSFINEPERLDEALKSLKGRRLCLCFGTWYHTPLNGAEDEEFDLEQDHKDWKMFCDLETLLQRACSGESHAISVLMAAGGEFRWRQMLENSS